ncbi:uncharacterized protein K444DRAFT_100132 [Hyaloscypha bicolor E]|uniref:KN homeodomain domain-containing protein n=1 Tax=Hyaloscypha bicolor E TaxID=1095630 RepID=A0A2J6SWN2_9HELO|nr:uncharacterized protein K444DRAFT_100132 [Hyaloscypha bicolor E]PMD55182.1 hypothetical protein K444DRAFT_100132 [Hyaloscypha bicolor E]
MELSPSRFQSPQQLNETIAEASSMSTLTMGRPQLLPSPSAMLWDEGRKLDLPSRPRSPPEKIELPSIRQAIPEIQLRTGRADGDYKTGSAISYSPTAVAALITPPEYVQSPSLHKRRRLSSDDGRDIESRDHVVPRMYRSPSRPLQRSQSVALSPTASARRVNTLSTTENWAGSNRTSPCCVTRGLPLPDSSSVSRSDWRPSLPSLPSLTLSHNNAVPRGRSTFSEYALESSRSGAQTYPHLSGSQFDPPISSYHPALSYGYQQPRGQSYSGPSTYPLTHDRSPFSNNHHNIYPGSSFSYGLERDDGNDSKQRKRRGNLPKETTDKLRAWFVAHLQHPYPTEDEKQELMRKTGLQMSKLPYECSPFFPQLIFCGLLNAENQFQIGFRVTEANLDRSNLELVHQRTSTAAANNDQ